MSDIEKVTKWTGAVWTALYDGLNNTVRTAVLDELNKLVARAETAEADNVRLREMVARLIEAGDKMAQDLEDEGLSSHGWQTLADEWSASQNKL